MEHPAYSQLRPVTTSTSVVLCANPSYTALEGTNSWLVSAPEDDAAIVVDPGPEDEGHLNILSARGERVALILLTHRHDDHAEGARRLRQLTGAPIRAFDERYCSDDAEALTHGEIISLEGITPEIEVVHTPGHTADSTSFFVWSGEVGETGLEGIISGDTIVGRHTTMISETDGDLGDYLKSLDLLATRGEGIPLLPGHGADLPDTSVMAEKYIERRNYRLRQIREQRAAHGPDIDLRTLVEKMYDDVDPVLRGAAQQSTRVALRYLAEHGE